MGIKTNDEYKQAWTLASYIEKERQLKSSGAGSIVGVKPANRGERTFSILRLLPAVADDPNLT